MFRFLCGHQSQKYSEVIDLQTIFKQSLNKAVFLWSWEYVAKQQSQASSMRSHVPPRPRPRATRKWPKSLQNQCALKTDGWREHRKIYGEIHVKITCCWIMMNLLNSFKFCFATRPAIPTTLKCCQPWSMSAISPSKFVQLSTRLSLAKKTWPPKRWTSGWTSNTPHLRHVNQVLRMLMQAEVRHWSPENMEFWFTSWLFIIPWAYCVEIMFQWCIFHFLDDIHTNRNYY